MGGRLDLAIIHRTAQGKEELARGMILWGPVFRKCSGSAATGRLGNHSREPFTPEGPFMKVALIEDDQEIVDVVSIGFEVGWAGSQVATALNGTEGVELVKAESPDIVILDIGLPEGSTYGLEVFTQIRTFSDVPIVILTAFTREVDIVRGLELGASDYISKPFSAMELLARVRAVLRRVQMWPLGTQGTPFVSEHLSVDFDSREVRVQGEPVKLTPTEYRLLCYMIRNPHRLLTNQALLEEVWGIENGKDRDMVKVHLYHLRNKLRDNTLIPRMLVTERGRGYRFVPPA